jgi:succinate dehydrogenase / fumarate reductase membrane anchor subunit
MVAKKSHRGLRNWLIQRITAVLIGLYVLFIIAYLLTYQPLSFEQWRGLYDSFLFKLITVIILLAIYWHTWIGLWTVLTDYVKSRGWRLLLQSLVILLLLAYVFWGLKILV